MRKLNKATALVLILAMVLSMGSFAFAEGEPESQAVKSGFYIKNAEGNKFIDIYTFLNNSSTYKEAITDAGLGNVLFVHQNGKGANLDKILEAENINDELTYLTEDSFEDSYTDVGSDKEIKPVLGLQLFDLVGENGKLTAVFEGIPAEGEPVVSEFVITKSIDGAEAETIEIAEADFAWNLETRRATLTVPEVEKAEDEQKVVYTVTYKEQEAKTTEIVIKGTKEPEYAFNVVLDKEKYNVDEDITVSGTVLYGKEGVSDIDITLKLEDVKGNEIDLEEEVIQLLSVGQIKTDTEGKFTNTFRVPSGTEAGTYKLTVKANNPVNIAKVLDLVLVGGVQEDEIPEAVIQDLAAKITKLYENVAEEDKPAIRDTRANLANITEDAWAGLLTDGVKAKFDDEIAAKEKIGAAIKDLSELYYSEDTTELEARLKTLAEKHLPTYRTIFGNEETVEELYDLFKVILNNVSNAITATQGNELVEATDAELVGKIEGIVKTTIDYTLEQEAYSKYKGRLSSVGLSVDNLIAVKSSIANEIDADGKAQIALINAYARVEAVVDGATTVKVGETANYTLTVLGKDVTTLANWTSSNTDVAIIEDDTEVKLTPVAAGTTNITVYRGDNEANWIAKFEVTVEEAEVVEPEVSTEAYDAIVASVPANNDEGIYTEDSWIEFEAAIAECDLTLTAEAGQEALDAEVIKIQAAIDLLVKAEETTKSNDATLVTLKYGETEITLEDGKLEYTVELSAGTTEVPVVSAVANDTNAKAEVTQAEALEDGKNVATIVVTAEDETVKTYTVTFTVKANE